MEEQQELPQGWELVRIADLCQVVAGIGFPKDIQGATSGELPFYKVSDISIAVKSGTKYLTGANNFISREQCAKLKARPLAENTIVFAKIGEALKLNRRAILSTTALVDNNVMGIRADSTVMYPLYCYYFLTTVDLAEYSQATTVPAVRKSDIENIGVPLPPLPEQRRIVAKLEELFSKLDAGVAAVRRTQALLKRYRQSVLHAAVTGELTRAWREAHPAPAETGAALLERIRAERRAQWEAAQVAKRGGQLTLGEGWKSKYVEPEAVDVEGLPELPEGWVWATAEQLCTFITKGSTPEKSELFEGQGEIPFVKVYNLTKTGKLDFTINSTYVRLKTHNNLLNRSRVFPGDILINIVGPPLGKVALVPDSHPEWNINQAIATFSPLPAYSSKFLLISLLTETIMKWLLKTAKTTTSQVNLTLAMCRMVPLPVPPKNEQAEIVAEVERRLTVLDALSQTLTDELKRAERLRQSILHRAFTGRLVPQDATDEPAAALLARLRETPTAPAKTKAGRGRKTVAQQTTLGL